MGLYKGRDNFQFIGTSGKYHPMKLGMYCLNSSVFLVIRLRATSIFSKISSKEILYIITINLHPRKSIFIFLLKKIKKYSSQGREYITTVKYTANEK